MTPSTSPQLSQMAVAVVVCQWKEFLLRAGAGGELTPEWDPCLLGSPLEDWAEQRFPYLYLAAHMQWGKGEFVFIALLGHRQNCLEMRHFTVPVFSFSLPCGIPVTATLPRT